MSLNDGYVYRERLGCQRGKTALAHLTDHYRHSTAAQWEARCARGEVTLDGVIATGAEPLREGQELSWSRPPWEEGEAPGTFELIYEDADLVAVAKPSGLSVLPSGGFLKRTLLHLVQARWPGAAPLHRLGRATSGLVLFSRTASAATRLSASWRDHEVRKSYRALSTGRAGEDRYEITASIGLVPHPTLEAVHGASLKGKAARSTAVVLERREGETLFRVDIHTGRPEQIRIHLAVIGHPLAGDPLFAVGGLPLQRAPGLPGDGGYLLHAESLAFTHPTSGEPVRLRAPPPAKLLRTGEAAG